MYLAIDIGGTKVDVCRFDEHYRLTMHERLASHSLRSRQMGLVEDIIALIKRCRTPEVAHIGLSLNCCFNRCGEVTYSSMLGLTDGRHKYPLGRVISEAVGQYVHTDDDLHALTLAEMELGQAKQLDSVLVLNLGTGPGIGFYESGVVLRGARNVAGVVFLQDYYVEELGEHVILDNLVCGNGISRLYHRFAGVKKEAREVFGALDIDPAARKSVDLFSKYLGKLLVTISYFYNPEVVLIAGSLKRAAACYLPAALQYYHAHTAEGYKISGIEPSTLEFGACLGVVCRSALSLADEQMKKLNGRSKLARR